MARPPSRPMMAPSPIWTKKPATRSMIRTSAAGSAPAAMISTSVMVRKMAIGSLVPDSISSVDLTRSRSCRLPARSRKKTAAASVEATAAPSRNDSSQLKSGQVEGGDAEQAGGDDDADGRERKRRHGGLAQRRDRRAEAGFEQDDGKRQCADEIGKARIVELDAESVDAGGQPEAEEEEQQGRAEAEGDQARKRRGEHERSADQRYEINRLIHSARCPSDLTFRALTQSAAKTRREQRGTARVFWRHAGRILAAVTKKPGRAGRGQTTPQQRYAGCRRRVSTRADAG